LTEFKYALPRTPTDVAVLRLYIIAIFITNSQNQAAKATSWLLFLSKVKKRDRLKLQLQYKDVPPERLYENCDIFIYVNY
jgi:hypothetical protein